MKPDLRLLEGAQTWRETWLRLSFFERLRLRHEIGSFKVQGDPHRAALTVGFIRRARNLSATRWRDLTYVYALGGWARGAWYADRLERCERQNLEVVERGVAADAS